MTLVCQLLEKGYFLSATLFAIHFRPAQSQLRNKLVLDLNPQLDELKSAKHKALAKSSSLALNALNSLIIDHLCSNQYDYTLSVFMPECGLQLNERFSLEDICKIFKISTSSVLYRQLTVHNSLDTHLFEVEFELNEVDMK